MINKKLILILLFSILIMPATLEAREVSRMDFVNKMNILFLKGDYTALITDTEKNMKRCRLGRTEKKEVLYLLGLSYIKTGNFEKSRKIFYDILEMKGTECREEAYVAIADSYFEEGKYDAAIESYKAALDRYPRTDRISGVYYNLSQSYKIKNDLEKANFYSKKITGQYDKSFEANKTSFIPTERETKYYVVQLGAFQDLKNAKALLRKLSKKRYDAYIQKTKKDGKVIYKVRGGKFSNESYAARLIRKLRRDRFQAKLIAE
ncbi:MAG: SPOR domain-containing protein [Candidatus Omnitrophota bacterium]